MTITTIGLDIGKNTFSAHGADERGRPLLARTIRRGKVLECFAQFPRCRVGMESGRGAHHWARELQGLGFEVKMMAPQHVKPYVQGNKTDARDAAGICEAAARESVPRVQVKSIEQQTILALHRVRSGWIRARVAIGNQLRGLLAEFGVALPAGERVVRDGLMQRLADRQLPEIMHDLVRMLLEQYHRLIALTGELEGRLRALHRQSEPGQRLDEIPGVGVLTASAIAASFPSVRHFKSARHFASSLGLTPKEFSSGGQQRLGGMSKRGNRYLRTLLIHGARSLLTHRPRAAGATNSWLEHLAARRGANVAVVAMANKNARTIWAMLARGERYRMPGSSRGSSASTQCASARVG